MGKRLGNNKSLVGMQFGRLTVLELRAERDGAGGRVWKCQCSCGTPTEVPTGRLRYGSTTSCGCAKIDASSRRAARDYNLLGKKFGLLTVRSLEERRANSGGRKWSCECECGNTTIVTSGNLRSGHIKSCGCTRAATVAESHKHRKFKFPKGEIGFRYFLRVYKYSAKNRGLEFSLTDDQIRNIAKQDCHYCGAPAERKWTGAVPSKHEQRDEHNAFVGNGVDRKNSTEGYTLTNSLPCCWSCNTAKNAMSYDEFISHVERIFSHKKLGA